MFFALLFGLIFGLFFGPMGALIIGLNIGLLSGLLFVLLFALSKKQLAERNALSPNKGIVRSGRYGVFFLLGAWLIGSLLVLLLFRQLVGPSAVLPGQLSAYQRVALLCGLLTAQFFGITCGLFCGLGAVLQHYVLRFWLWRANLLPYRLVLFLEQGVERLFLYRLGGNYLFMHRLLLEYFVGLAEPSLTEELDGEATLDATRTAQSAKGKRTGRRKRRR